MSETQLLPLIRHALNEDCPTSDITCTSLKLSNAVVSARLIAKEDGVFFGKDVATIICNEVDPKLRLTCAINDGSNIQKMQTIATIEGPSLSLLRAERIVLNFLQRLSGIATATSRFVSALNNPLISVLDTRKTTPGLRFLEKQAVVAGGGKNHRHSLSDMVLIKENHLETLTKEGRLHELEALLIHHKKNDPTIPIEIEIETVDQIQSLPLHLADFIMLDNFSIPDIYKATTLLNEKNIRAEIEVSGGITLENIATYSPLPIQRISIGALTHSVKALDLSLLAN